jgi:hypothetical protein
MASRTKEEGVRQQQCAIDSINRIGSFAVPDVSAILNLHDASTNGRGFDHATESGRQQRQELLGDRDGVRDACPLTSCAACIPASSKAAAASSTADHIERDLHVATRRMRVGTDLLFRGEFLLVVGLRLTCGKWFRNG